MESETAKAPKIPTLQDVQAALDKTGLTLVLTPVYNPMRGRHVYSVALARKTGGGEAMWEAIGDFNYVIAALVQAAKEHG